MPEHRGYATIASAIVTAMLSAGCGAPPPMSNQADAERRVAVRTVAVTQTEIQQSTLQPASVHAYYRSEIQPKASGFVTEIKVDLGDVVQAGDVLAVIDVPEMKQQREVIDARIVRLEAEEKRAAVGVDLAKAGVRSAEASFSEAESELKRVAASLAAVESEFARTEDLVQRGSLQERMLDEVRKKRDSERAAKQAVVSSIETARANVAVAEAETAAAVADQEAAGAETEIARRQLEELDIMIAYATVRAPISGRVTQRSVEPGDLVGNPSQQSSSKPLFVISKVDELRVHIPVPESDAARIDRGDEVKLTFPSLSGEPPIEATVTRLAGSLDPSTRTMIVEVVLENPDGKLLPGMFGQAAINVSTKVAANMLPARAIRFTEDGKAYVYVVGQDETVSVTSIETGFDDGSSIEVRVGLESGQRVIDAHLKRFTDGQKVSVLTDEPS